MSIQKFNRAGELIVNEPQFAPQSVVCRAYVGANVAFTSGNVIPYNTKDFDPYNFFDPTLYRFNPKVAGYYRVASTAWLAAYISSSGSNLYAELSLRKNGTQIKDVVEYQGAGQWVGMQAVDLVYLNGTTDYVDTVWSWSGGGSINIYAGAGVNPKGWTTFEATLEGATVGVTPEPWHFVGAAGEPAFANSWVNYGPTEESAAFFKDPHGIVWLKGEVKSGVTPFTIFQLPAGYRPAFTRRWYCDNNGTAMRVNVTAAGVVSAAATSVALDLSPISFRAEQ